MQPAIETKVRNRDVKVVSNPKLKPLADGKALGLRLVHYTDRISADRYLEEGLPFGTSLGASEMKATIVPLLSAQHDGTLAYQPAGDPDSVSFTNLNLLATRQRLVTGWSTCTMLIVFPDDPVRYREISTLQASQDNSDSLSKADTYLQLTLSWLNHFIDFSPVGRQIIPRAFIGGFIDLDKKELVRNIHYSETFIQSAQAKQKLPRRS